METKTKKILISKAGEIKKTRSFLTLRQEIEPLLSEISKEECPDEVRELELIIKDINKILSEAGETGNEKNLLKTKNEISNILCDLLCF